LRAMLGVFMGGVFPSAMALVGLSAPPESRGLVYGLTGSAQALGGAVGPLFGAFTAAAFGMRAVFACTAVILLGVAGMVARDVRYNSASALSGRGNGGVPPDSPSLRQRGDSENLPH
jgi:DHA1 family multidrug resistance protein-like MFS transporter